MAFMNGINYIHYNRTLFCKLAKVAHINLHVFRRNVALTNQFYIKLFRNLGATCLDSRKRDNFIITTIIIHKIKIEDNIH